MSHHSCLGPRTWLWGTGEGGGDCRTLPWLPIEPSGLGSRLCSSPYLSGFTFFFLHLLWLLFWLLALSPAQPA